MLPVDTSTGALTVYFLSCEALLAAFRFDGAVGVERFKKKTRKRQSESSFPEQTRVEQLVSFIEFYFITICHFFCVMKISKTVGQNCTLALVLRS